MHTRLIRCVRGRAGTIEGYVGRFFPGTNAHGQGENPQWLYTLRVACDLLGPETDQVLKVSADASELISSSPTDVMDGR
jgi:nitrile hydratase